MPCAIVIGCAPVVDVHRPAEARHRSWTRWRSPAGSPARRSGSAKCVTVDLDVPADAEIVIEGLIDPESARAGRAVRRKPRPHRARRLQHVDAGDRDHAQAQRRCSCRSSARSRRASRACIKKVAYEPMFLAHLRDHLGIKGVRARGAARAAVQPAAGDLPAVRARHAAHRGVARAARRRDAAAPTAARSASR